MYPSKPKMARLHRQNRIRVSGQVPEAHPKRPRQLSTSASGSRRLRQPQPQRKRQRQYRLSLGGNTRSQKTLTQIDFVTLSATNDLLRDEDLEYIHDQDNELPMESLSRRTVNNGKARAKCGGNETLTQRG